MTHSLKNIDLNNAAVEILINEHDGRLWINVDGACLLRVRRLDALHLYTTKRAREIFTMEPRKNSKRPPASLQPDHQSDE
jgi:hypothetical protein